MQRKKLPIIFLPIFSAVSKKTHVIALILLSVYLMPWKIIQLGLSILISFALMARRPL